MAIPIVKTSVTQGYLIMYEEQLKLERLMDEESISRFNDRKDEAIRKGRYDTTTAGQRLVTSQIMKVAEAIRDFTNTLGKPSRHAQAAIGLSVLPAEVLAQIALIGCIATTGRGTKHHVTVSTISKLITDEINMRKLKVESPSVFHWLEEGNKAAHTNNRRHIRNKTLAMMVKNGITPTKPCTVYKMVLKLIEIVCESTGLFELLTVKDTDSIKPKSYLMFSPTPACVDWLMKAEGTAALLMPINQPMVYPPKPWTNLTDGGYLERKHPFIRGLNRKGADELAKHDISPLTTTVNAAQETAWALNNPVFEVATTLWQGGGNMAKLPRADDEPQVTPYNPEWEKAEQTKWCKEENARHTRNHQLAGKRIATISTLTIAKRFSEYPLFYFPHNTDWRGRVYPIPVFLQPQGGDLAKGLLRFSKGLPLGSEGWRWLAVHVANCWGYDKESFDNRIKWTIEHKDLIIETALNPLVGSCKWMEADSPFMFLAACLEWRGYLEEGEGFISHLSINLDGAANGMQHLSALVRDEDGGRATCLIPGDKPADIYTAVRLSAESQVALDVAEGVEFAPRLLGKITRDMTKPATMRKPYGSKAFGMKNVISEVLIDEGLSSLDNRDHYAFAWYATQLLDKAVCDAVQSASVVMGFLQEVARVVASAGLEVWWHTPNGIPICQNYKKSIAAPIKTYFQGRTVNTHIYSEGTELHKSKQSNGISPNFIHSLDAAHMQATVGLCLDAGVTDLCLIHDSYGTHAANVPILANRLRVAFVNQYSKDVLGEFLAGIKGQLAGHPKLIAKLPELPVKGTLDLSKVMASDYFFA